MSNDDDNAQPNIPEPVDDAAEPEVVAHSYEQSEESPGCVLRMDPD